MEGVDATGVSELEEMVISGICVESGVCSILLRGESRDSTLADVTSGFGTSGTALGGNGADSDWGVNND